MVHRAVLLANLVAVVTASPLYRRDTVTTLVAGDSIDKIASSASLQLADVSAANPGVDLAVITPGQVITIPAVPAAATAAPLVSAAITAPAITGGDPAIATPVPDGGKPQTIATDSPLPTGGAPQTNATDSPLPDGGAPQTIATGGAPLPIQTATVTAPGASVASLAPNEGSQNDGNPDAYTFFKGDGKDGWPTRDQWISFDEMFKRNSEVMGQGCVGEVTSNTPGDNNNIKQAILDLAPVALVDPRFILAIVMQESNGCVRVKGTPSREAGVFNPGLMQTFKGTGTCNVGNSNELNPCPLDQITQMIIDGVQGTIQNGAPAQAGLVQRMNEAGGDANGQVYYGGARIYNTGSIPDKSALESAGQCGPPRTFGVPCYSSDIANRLLGWVKGATQCDLKPAANCLPSF